MTRARRTEQTVDHRHRHQVARMTADAEEADTLARRLLLLSVLAGRVAEAKSEVKDQLEKLVKVGTLLRPQVQGQAAGSVSYTAGKKSAAVYSDAEFTAWVREHHPEHLSLQPVVDPEFRADCVVASERAGVPVSRYGDLDVRGIHATTGQPSLIVRPNKARAAELWREIRVAELIGELDEGEKS